MGFSNVAGVLVADDQEKFARTIFRATRGNAFTHFESIDSEILDIKTGKAIQKVVFVIYFQAGTGLQSALRDKILRICQAYSANLYDWPKSSTDAGIQISRLDVVIQDKAKALEAYEDFFVSESSALLEVHRVSPPAITLFLFFCFFFALSIFSVFIHAAWWRLLD